MNLPAFLHLAPLAGFLLAAVWWDFRARRIPNWLVLSGAIYGLCWNLLAPGGLGFVPAALGLMFGLVLLLPMYLARAMGAGDVKLMAMAGAFLGPADVLGAALGTLLAGGVLAVAFALHAGKLRRLAANLQFMLLDSASRWYARKPPQPGDLPGPVGHLPFALAIAFGTLGYLCWRHYG